MSTSGGSDPTTFEQFPSSGGGGGAVPSTRAINTTAPLAGGGNLTADRTISIPKATDTTDGYLSAADWTTFNSKLAAFGNQAINTVYAGPGSGGATAPTFRTLVAADIPGLPASKITSGQVAKAQGGLGSDLSNTWWPFFDKVVYINAPGTFFLTRYDTADSSVNNAAAVSVPPGHNEAGGITVATEINLAGGYSIVVEIVSLDKPISPTAATSFSPSPLTVTLPAGSSRAQNASTARSLAAVQYIGIKLTVTGYMGNVNIQAGTRP